MLRVDRRCLARFQGFPDPHRWGPVVSVNCRGIGDAVPPLISKAVGLTLFHGIIQESVLISCHETTKGRQEAKAGYSTEAINQA